jgi:hypothetical protein
MADTDDTAQGQLALTYVLPIRCGADEDLSELADYLRWLCGVVAQVIVVDGSEADLRRGHRDLFDKGVELYQPEIYTEMGKIGGVLTGLRYANLEKVILADDDVRYEPWQLERVLDLLQRADVVRPQNYFDPLPWHARFDTARTLLNRLSGGDWPGTLGVRRSIVVRDGGYSGAALFENLELVRTVRARGGTESVPLDLFVRRLPPTTRHFWGQQTRQAYDEIARPARLLVFLAALPAAVVAARRSPRHLAVAAASVIALAAAGRRRGSGRVVFAPTSSLLAPVWLIWRSVCSWVALGSWLRGGVRYRGNRLRLAATSPRTLRNRARVNSGTRHLLTP